MESETVFFQSHRIRQEMYCVDSLDSWKMKTAPVRSRTGTSSPEVIHGTDAIGDAKHAPDHCRAHFTYMRKRGQLAALKRVAFGAPEKHPAPAREAGASRHEAVSHNDHQGQQ